MHVWQKTMHELDTGLEEGERALLKFSGSVGPHFHYLKQVSLARRIWVEYMAFRYGIGLGKMCLRDVLFLVTSRWLMI